MSGMMDRKGKICYNRLREWQKLLKFDIQGVMKDADGR